MTRQQDGWLEQSREAKMYWLIWIGIAIVMAIIEIATTTLITIWFFIGGLAAAVAAYFGAGLTLQIILFIVLSLATLALFRPLIMKHRASNVIDPSSPIGRGEATPLGQQAVVVEAIDNTAGKGRVETPDRMSWVALSEDGSPIPLGARVAIVDVQSVKLVVKELPADAPAGSKASAE